MQVDGHAWQVRFSQIRVGEAQEVEREGHVEARERALDELVVLP